MSIKKTIAVVIAAAFVLSLTACANNETPKETSSGLGNTQTTSSEVENTQTSSNNNPFIDDGNTDREETPALEPVKETGTWDVLPEIPVTDASAFKYEYDSKRGGMVVTDYLRESPKVRIPDTLEGEPVVRVDLEDCNKELTQLIMPDSVKSFRLSSKIKFGLQYVNIPNSVFVIDEEAFSGCNSFTSVTIPDRVITIGMRAFNSCANLTSVTIGDGVTRIEQEAFYSCKSLTSVTIPDSVKEIGYMAFGYCTSLTSVTFKGKTYDYEHIDDLYEAINNN